MAIRVPSWRYGGAPVNASPTWNQACSFWRSSSDTCPSKVWIYGSAGWNIAIESALWSGKIGNVWSGAACPGSNSYVAMVGFNSWGIDIWAALKDGAWTSSLAVDVYADNGFATTNTYSLSCGPAGDGVSGRTPTDISYSIGVTPGAGGCATTMRKTATFYDDGTFTFA